MLAAVGIMLILMTVFMPEEWESKKRESRSVVAFVTELLGIV